MQSPFTVVQQCNRAFFFFFTFAMLVIHIKKYTVEKHGTQITPYLLLSEAGCGVEIERGVYLLAMNWFVCPVRRVPDIPLLAQQI